MIYTAGTLARGQSTSESFISMGAVNMAPSKIGEVRVQAPITKPSTRVLNFAAMLWAFVASILSAGIVVNPLSTYLCLGTGPLPLPLPRPPLIVTFRNETKEIADKMTAQGFTKLSQGQYKYWKGAGTEENIQIAISLGGQADAYSPRNNTSIYGISTFTVFNRVLGAAFSAIRQGPTPDQTIGEGDSAYEVKFFESEYKLAMSFKSFIIDQALEALPEWGNFFPYFNGLLLPDDDVTVSTFTRHFSCLLGKTPNEIAENLSIIISGWATLSGTTAGKEFSHMFFCLDLAIQAGLVVQPVFLHGTYAGCLFSGRNAWFLHGKTLKKAVDKSTLLEEIGSMVSHEPALKSICAILSGFKLQNGGEPTDVKPETITTPRMLHYAIIERKLTSSDQDTIRKDLKKLMFKQTYWEVTDAKKLQAAVATMVAKGRLDDRAPCFMFSDGFFSTEPLYSVLLAYGDSAPSLIGFGTNVVRPLAKDTYKGVQKPAPLVGIPFFKKAVQSAYEDWRALLKEGGLVVKFGHAGKDKLGRLSVKKVAGYVVFDSDEEKQIMASLLRAKDMAAGKGKKREAESSGAIPVVDEEAEERRKRRRLQGFGLLGAIGAPVALEAAEEDIGDHEMDDPYA